MYRLRRNESSGVLDFFLFVGNISDFFLPSTEKLRRVAFKRKVIVVGRCC